MMGLSLLVGKYRLGTSLSRTLALELNTCKFLMIMTPDLLQELNFKSKPNVWAYFSVKVHCFDAIFAYPAAS